MQFANSQLLHLFLVDPLSEERFHQVMGQQSLWASIYYASNRFLSLSFAFLCLLARSKENLRCILYDEIYLSEGWLPKQLMSIDLVGGDVANCPAVFLIVDLL